ncbi:MAG TPA: transcription antitermination factor NusB [Candidatus Polarisedimenticolia bacterium]|nr:transcription antitermination factor NusB [Candidatus Polarisedimenticolia bacterium]
MAARHRAREYALQMLYQSEVGGAAMPDVAAHFFDGGDVPTDIRDFAIRLAAGADGARTEIDALLAASIDHWRLERLGAVDRNVLRLAVYEFLHETETPRIVIIDEAIEVAKRFGGEESGQFVNGVLDGLRRRLEGSPEA